MVHLVDMEVSAATKAQHQIPTDLPILSPWCVRNDLEAALGDTNTKVQLLVRAYYDCSRAFLTGPGHTISYFRNPHSLLTRAR